MLYRRLLTGISAVLCVLFFAVSCNDSPSSVNDEPPQLPPVRSMEMDFSNFQSQKSVSDAQTQTVANFTRAVGTAIVLKTVVDLNLAIPRALLTAAHNAEAELNEDEEWVWDFSKTAGDSSYSVRLVASREAEDTVNWNFYVTNTELGWENQLFFSGTTNADATEGTWSYYNLQNTESQEQVSQVEWTINGEDDIELRLEVTSDRHGYQGDYIDYTFDGTTKTAAYYDNSDDEKTKIQLNVDTHAGYIIAPEYNNGEKACWNENFQDIACSEL